MLGDWRRDLYYLLGLLPSIFFGSRFFIQWIKSEVKKQSHVSSLFWKLSISGNLLLALHYFIQFQYYFLMIQVVNAFVSWRNLNFLQNKKQPHTFSKALLILSLSLGITILLCGFQNLITSTRVNFLAPPKGIFGEVQEGVHLVWNIFGMIGAILFASRFWIQWLQAEKNQYSFFSTYFWVISLIGSSLCLLYFIHILDWVSVANYSFGIIPYIRNLFLIRRERLSEMTEQNRLG